MFLWKNRVAINFASMLLVACKHHNKGVLHPRLRYHCWAHFSFLFFFSILFKVNPSANAVIPSIATLSIKLKIWWMFERAGRTLNCQTIWQQIIWQKFRACMGCLINKWEKKASTRDPLQSFHEQTILCTTILFFHTSYEIKTKIIATQNLVPRFSCCSFCENLSILASFTPAEPILKKQ